jgi:hypothetical protein
MQGFALITCRASADYMHAVGVIWRGGAGKYGLIADNLAWFDN